MVLNSMGLGSETHCSSEPNCNCTRQILSVISDRPITDSNKNMILGPIWVLDM
jgi:hypothetical protein